MYKTLTTRYRAICQVKFELIYNYLQATITFHFSNCIRISNRPKTYHHHNTHTVTFTTLVTPALHASEADTIGLEKHLGQMQIESPLTNNKLCCSATLIYIHVYDYPFSQINPLFNTNGKCKNLQTGNIQTPNSILRSQKEQYLFKNTAECWNNILGEEWCICIANILHNGVDEV